MTASPAARGQEHGLDVGDLSTVHISAVRSPQLSLVQWLLDAAAVSAAPSRFASAIAMSARAPARFAYRSLGMPGLDRLPDCTTPILSEFDVPVERQVAWLREAEEDRLLRELAGLWSEAPPKPWQAVREDPRGWMASLAQASADAWTVAEPRWRRGQRALDREFARIGTAVMSGCADALLNSLHPRIRFRDGHVEFRSGCDQSVPLNRRRLVLAPMLVRSERVIVSFDRPDIAYIAYPIAAQDDAGGAWGHRSRLEQLDAILGPLRARALYGLAQPRAMNELAAYLNCAPSTATYHCDQLEAAGLIVRERRGQSMWARRTTRAERLLDALLS